MFLFVCINISCKNKMEKKPVPQILRYYRVDIGVGSYYTYYDLLRVMNYENNTMFAKDLLNVAFKYLDTVRSDKPVSGINFIGEVHGTTLPPANWKYLQVQKKYFIIRFGFSNNFIQNKNKPFTLNSIAIWKNGRSLDYTKKEEIDSILKSRIPLDNK